MYVLQNQFQRVPEFTQHYRNLSAHSNKSLEDPIILHLMRSLVGLAQLKNGCNFSMPSESQAREKLGISRQERVISALMITSEQKELLGEYKVNRGLVLRPEYQDAFLPAQGMSSMSSLHKWIVDSGSNHLQNVTSSHIFCVRSNFLFKTDIL